MLELTVLQPWNVVTFELYWLTFMYTTHQTNNLNSGFFLQQHWLISKYRQYICDYSLLALCHFILLWMCFHQSPNALPPQTQHNFWNGLEALAPASKLMQKCCLYSHKRLLYVVEGCFLLSTLYQWRTSENVLSNWYTLWAFLSSEAGKSRLLATESLLTMPW